MELFNSVPAGLQARFGEGGESRGEVCGSVLCGLPWPAPRPPQEYPHMCRKLSNQAHTQHLLSKGHYLSYFPSSSPSLCLLCEHNNQYLCFHSQKCPSLDDKLSSHVTWYGAIWCPGMPELKSYLCYLLAH